MNYFTSIFITEDEGEIIIPRAFFLMEIGVWP